MITGKFDYYAPRSLPEAIGLLQEHGYDAKILAGGQSLIPAMRFRLAMTPVLIDINEIEGLGYVRESNGVLTIGAMTREAELEKLLEEFHITELRDSPAMALSGGERRRCEIARALAAKPSIMLLDEPFAGIDPLSIADIRHLVIELKNRGIGVLITDHNVRETLDIVDRACIIYGGQVLFAGSPQDLVADENVRRLYLGEGFTL